MILAIRVVNRGAKLRVLDQTACHVPRACINPKVWRAVLGAGVESSEAVKFADSDRENRFACAHVIKCHVFTVVI